MSLPIRTLQTDNFKKSNLPLIREEGMKEAKPEQQFTQKQRPENDAIQRKCFLGASERRFQASEAVSCPADAAAITTAATHWIRGASTCNCNFESDVMNKGDSDLWQHRRSKRGG